MHQEIQAGNSRGASARDHQLDLADVLAHHLQTVQDRGRRNDRRAVLVVVEDGDAHALAQLLFDIKAFGRLDVLEVDAAQGRLKRRDDLDELVRIGLSQLDVEHVDAGELLEKATFTLHHGLGRQWSDIAKAQHGCPVGDDGHQVRARGVFRRGFVTFGVDRHAGRSHPGRVGKRQVVLIGQRFGGGDGNLAGCRKRVVVEGQFFEILIHVGPA